MVLRMTPENLARAAEVLSEADLVAMACHVNPDPDALGSMLGLGQFLRARGARVACSWAQQPLELPRWANALDGRDLLVEPKEDRAYTIFAQSMDRSGYARGTLAPALGMEAEIPPLDPRNIILKIAAAKNFELALKLTGPARQGFVLAGEILLLFDLAPGFLKSADQ